MNPFEMVVVIVLIVTIGRVAAARHGRGRWRSGDWQRDDGGDLSLQEARDPEADRLRDEVRALKDRIAVLERIATDGDHRRGLELERQIEALRDRREAGGAGQP